MKLINEVETINSFSSLYNGSTCRVPVRKLEDLSDGVEKRMEDQIEPDQPEQMVGY
jgi:hypothetical protein